MTAVSDVSICNLALQKLGAARISQFSDDKREARSMNACYELIRDAEMRRHPWSFAKKRQVLAPDATAPAFDFAYAFTLPAGCLRILEPNRNDLDWQIEGGKILTNDGDSINLVFIQRVTDPTSFDAAFVEALAAKLAWHCCEEITQSNQKKADILAEYKDLIRDAKRVNAIEKIPDDPPEDTWITARA